MQIKDDANFVFEGEPEVNLNVAEEAQKQVGGLVYDPERLSQILIQLGERMIGVPLYDFQKEVVHRIFYSLLTIDGAEITVLVSRQAGKSEIIAFTSVVIAVLMPLLAKIFPKELGHFKNGVKMGLIAPQLDQVDTVYVRCMERLLSEPCKQFMVDPDVADEALSRVNFKLKSGSFMKAQSGAKQSKIESKSYHLVYLDESQDIEKEKVRKSVIPMTASTFGTIVRFGTPNRTKGDFYYTITNNKAHDKQLKPKDRANKRLHYEYDYKAVVASKQRQFKVDGKTFHTLYEKSLERDRKSMGENSEEFRMSYKLEWLHEVGMFVTEDFMEKNVYNSRIGFPDVHKDSFVVAGLDIASARASTVVTLGMVENPAEEFGDRPRKTVIGWLELSGANYDEQLPILINFLLENNVKVLYGDYTGVGRVLIDLLTFQLSDFMEIIPYVFSPVSKSDMWKRWEEDMLNGRFVVPAHKSIRQVKEWQHFNEQVLNLQKYWRGSYMVCEKISGFMDDYCDSGALMNLAGNHLYMPPSPMEVVDNFFIGKNRASMRQKSSW